MRFLTIYVILILPLLFSCGYHKNHFPKPREVFKRHDCIGWFSKNKHIFKREKRLERVREKGCLDNSADCGHPLGH